jgi:sugar-specific transcriptional regulator TrmB
MDTSLLITLQEYGLSEKEAKVYLTILELGTNIASTIARRSEIKRVTVYTILDDLKKK